MDVLALRDWILERLDKAQVTSPQSIAVLRGITDTPDSSRAIFSHQALQAGYQTISSKGGKLSDSTISSAVSIVNRELLAAACFGHNPRSNQHWSLSARDNSRVVPKEYRPAWSKALRKIHRGLDNPSPEAFFLAWLQRPEVSGPLTIRSDNRDVEVQAQREILDATERDVSKLLDQIGQSIADRTSVELIAKWWRGVPTSLIEQAEQFAKDHHGRFTRLDSQSFAIEFASDTDYSLPATRAISVVHKLFRNTQAQKQDRSTGAISPLPMRLLIRATPDQSHDRNAITVSLGMLNPPAVAGSVYLDSYMWRTIGRWVRAIRHAPEPWPIPNHLGGEWSLLKGLGAEDTVFNTFTADAGPMVCRDIQIKELLTSWKRVQEDRTPQVVSVVGEGGSGKRMLINHFLQHHVQPDSATVFSLDFCRGVAEYPYRPFIDQLIRALDIDTSANHAAQRSQLKRALKPYPGIRPMHLDAVIELFEKPRRAEREGDIGPPGQVDGDPRRLQSSLRTIATAILAKLATEKPVIITVTDFDEAGQATRQMLVTLCQDLEDVPSLRNKPLMIVASGREAASLDALLPHTRIRLDGLTEHEMKAIVKGLAEQKVIVPKAKLRELIHPKDNYPGRFLDQVVLGNAASHPTERCHATMAILARPTEGLPYPSRLSLIQGTVALLSLLGPTVSQGTLEEIILRILKIKHLPKESVEAVRKQIRLRLDEYLQTACHAGILNRSGTDDHPKGYWYKFNNQRDATDIQRVVSHCLSAEPMSRLAMAISKSTTEPDAKLWEAAARLMSGRILTDQASRYWLGAGISALRIGQPEPAIKQFRRAYHFAVRVMRGTAKPTEDLRLRPYLAYQCYLKAARLLDLGMAPSERNRFRLEMRHAGIRQRRDKHLFNARLIQWHFDDIQGQPIRAAARIKMMRKALDHQTTPVNHQQQLELAYVAWNTAILQGELREADSRYSEMLSLYYPLGPTGQARGVSSGHDLGFYAPAKHCCVQWLSGSLRAFDTVMNRQLILMGRSGSDHAHRVFWSAAYLLPSALFENRKSDVERLAGLIRQHGHTSLGPTVRGLVQWLTNIAKLTEIQDEASLQDLMQVALNPRSSGQGPKYSSIWVSLIARHHLAVRHPDLIQSLRPSLELTISSCTERQERFLLAELYRLKALSYEAEGLAEQVLPDLEKALEIAQEQKAMTLVVLILLDIIRINTATSDQHAHARRLIQLREAISQCDIPKGHPLCKRASRYLGG